MGTLEMRFDDACYAVVDVETTGLRPGYDRVVEIAVVHVDPGRAPIIAFETLVDPRRPLEGQRIHCIREDDLCDAPAIEDIRDAVLAALSGRVLVGHNLGFDLRFLEESLPTRAPSPMLDTSALRPLLRDGPRASLDEMCRVYGLQRSGAHMAAADAFDTARVLQVLLARARQQGLRTFREVSRLSAAAWLASLRLDLPPHHPPPVVVRQKSRAMTGSPPDPLRLYYDLLMMVLADSQVTEMEVAGLIAARATLGLDVDDVDALHAQAFAGALLAGVADRKIHEPERCYLRNLARCLRSLGWCPGD